jgi:hypothetical protein
MEMSYSDSGYDTDSITREGRCSSETFEFDSNGMYFQGEIKEEEVLWIINQIPLGSYLELNPECPLRPKSLCNVFIILRDDEASTGVEMVSKKPKPLPFKLSFKLQDIYFKSW